MKKENKFFLVFVGFSLLAITKSYATDGIQDTVRTSYNWSEKWYYQLQGGVNYLAAENTRFVSIGKILAPSLTFAVGKRFTPIWGSRLQLLYGNDNGVYYARKKDSPLFSFRHYGIIAEGTFNFSNFIRMNRVVGNEKKWNVDFKLGVGFIHSGSYELSPDVKDYKWLDPVPRDNFAIYAGLEVSRVVYKNIDVNLEFNINKLSNKYNGQVCGDRNSEVIGDILATALIGVRYTIPTQKTCKKEFVYINAYSTVLPEKNTTTSAKTEAPQKETSQEVIIEPKCYDIEELLQMVEQKKTIKGKKICSVEIIYFDFDKSNIKNEFALYLDKLAALMLNSPDINLLIMGHTDVKGSVDYNYGLSERRSKAVMTYLNNKGVNYNRMIFSYYSKLSPRTENITDFGRSVNRRVEFMILP